MPIDLSQLRPLQISTEPSLFPLAWGWWVMIFSVLVSGVFLYFLVQYILGQEKRLALSELKQIKKKTGKEFVSEINALLKRTAIVRYGAENVASLYGEAWVSFLNKTKECHFSDYFVALLKKNLYAERIDLSENERQEIVRQVSCWIRRNL